MTVPSAGCIAGSRSGTVIQGTVMHVETTARYTDHGPVMNVLNTDMVLLLIKVC